MARSCELFESYLVIESTVPVVPSRYAVLPVRPGAVPNRHGFLLGLLLRYLLVVFPIEIWHLPVGNQNDGAASILSDWLFS